MQPPSSQPYTVRLIIWAGMAFAPVMYFVVTRMAAPAAAQENPMLVNILLVMAVGLVAASFGAKSAFKQRQAASAPSNGVRPGELLALAMCEAAALFGVMAWFITATPLYFWFLVLGGVGMLLHFPQRDSQ